MKQTFALLCFCMLWSFSYSQTMQSPNKKVKLTTALTTAGELTYSLSVDGKAVIKPSGLGVALKDLQSLTKEFTITKIDSTSVDESWNPVWGEVKTIRNNYKELSLTLQHSSKRTIVVRFRVFNDGLGFRYEFPIQENLNQFIVTDEVTQFNLTGNHKTFWIPGDYDTNEYVYNTTKISDINSKKTDEINQISGQSPTQQNTVQTPLMMKSEDGLYINIHEAALVNYPAMNLNVTNTSYTLTAHLVPDVYGNKAYLQTPFTTPWRTIIASSKASDVVGSKMILNLNEPSKIADTDWIKPLKYVGIWWEMHVNRSVWYYSNDQKVPHGATTENTKRYIDFASSHGFDGVLVEGWNIGWGDKESFDFITPYPDFNIPELKEYANSKGVKLIMHHETYGNVSNYERRMDEAYRFMKANGYDAVKTGYVGKINPRGEHHDGQWMINHYEWVAKKTADYKIMLNAHEPVRPTGLHRTYPNWLACEAARGNEFNAWSLGNPPEHETILPFTRLIGGPMDYTPGIFEIKMSYYDNKKTTQVHTTLAKQLALYITMYSPLQMAADLPESYEKRMDAFQFIKDVGVDWDDTKIVEAEPGDYLTIARKAKGKESWFVGAITDENKRTSTLPLSFLTANEWYVATLYTDAPDAHWQNNPMAYRIQKVLVNSKNVLKLALAEGGGAAISLIKASPAELKTLKKYK
jgi:hypothetical protein